MKVNEIFNSIQGEGPQIGRPATFIRLAGCNMGCEWCDTKYAWDKGENMTIDEIVQRLARRRRSKLIIFTGGEPTVQGVELTELTKRLTMFDFEMALETNGYSFHSELAGLIDTVIVSPKLGNPQIGRMLMGKKEEDYITRLGKWGRSGAYFKYVIDMEPDAWDPMEVIWTGLHIAKMCGVKETKVYLQPMAKTTDAKLDGGFPAKMTARFDALATLVLKEDLDCHVLPQLHRWMEWK